MIKILLAVLALLPNAAIAASDNLSANDLTARLIERRAFEAVVWGVPAVNYDLMYQQMLNLGGQPNQIVYWSGLFDWQNQTLTPNPDVIYLMAFFNTQNGPAGIDKGAGGKYLILPPSYEGIVPDGYYALPSANYQGYALLRSIPKSGNKQDVDKAVAYGKKINLYPLSQASDRLQTVFLDALGKVYDSTVSSKASLGSFETKR